MLFETVRDSVLRCATFMIALLLLTAPLTWISSESTAVADQFDTARQAITEAEEDRETIVDLISALTQQIIELEQKIDAIKLQLASLDQRVSALEQDQPDDPQPSPDPGPDPQPEPEPDPEFTSIRSFEELQANWKPNSKLRIVEDIDWPRQLTMPAGMHLRVDATCIWTSGPTTAFHINVSGPGSFVIDGNGTFQGSLTSIQNPPTGREWMRGWGSGGIRLVQKPVVSISGVTFEHCNGIMTNQGGVQVLIANSVTLIDSWRYGFFLGGPSDASATLENIVVRRAHHEHDIRSYINTVARNIETSGNRAGKIAYWGVKGHHDVRNIKSDMRILFGPNFNEPADRRVSFHCEDADVRLIGCWNGTQGLEVDGVNRMSRIINCPNAAISFGSTGSPRQPRPRDICWTNVRSVRTQSWMSARNIRPCE